VQKKTEGETGQSWFNWNTTEHKTGTKSKGHQHLSKLQCAQNIYRCMLHT